MSSEGTFGITGIPIAQELVKVMTKTIPYAPGTPLRREISEFASPSDPLTQKQWTLFVLALEKFQNMPVDQKLSYFQVAGIHGFPETPWDLASAPKQDPKPPPGQVTLPPGWQPYGGYCHHNTIAFPTWHRPYMLLFEQCIWLNMEQIITSWNLTGDEQQEWMNAAQTWRLPYWDWARKQASATSYTLPFVLAQSTVTIFPPPSASISNTNSYNNPAWKFSNPEKDSNGTALPFGQMPPGKTQWNIKDNTSDPTITLPWKDCSATSRYGLSSTDQGQNWKGLTGNNNVQGLTSAMAHFQFYDPNRDHQTKGIPTSLQDAVSRMFSPDYNGTWGTFSSTKWFVEMEEDLQTGYMSLEYIHNNVHNEVGGSDYHGLGHMSDVPVAAFDPIFWLHHCNIDRLLAMWQALNWDKWWDDPEPTKAGSNVRNVPADEALPPFHTRDNGDPNEDYWTSDMARDWTKLQYQYDDLVPSADAILPDKTLDEGQYKQDLQAYINGMYPSTSKLVNRIVYDPNIPTEAFLGRADGVWNDYVINIVYDRYALEGRSYSIQFFIGGKPYDTDSTFSYPENFVGQLFSFGGLGAVSPVVANGGGCANCSAQSDAQVLSKGQVPITHQLIRQALDQSYTHIDNIANDAVKDYLTKHLHWKFVGLGGERPGSDFPNTKISVWSGLGKPPMVDGDPGAFPPTYEQYTPIYSATDGKPGGLRRNDAVLGE